MRRVNIVATRVTTPVLRSSPPQNLKVRILPSYSGGTGQTQTGIWSGGYMVIPLKPQAHKPRVMTMIMKRIQKPSSPRGAGVVGMATSQKIQNGIASVNGVGNIYIPLRTNPSKPSIPSVASATIHVDNFPFATSLIKPPFKQCFSILVYGKNNNIQ